jgi:hypothetical protein
MFFSETSRPALGPIQLPTQCMPGAPFLGVKWPEHEAHHSPASCATVKNEWSYAFMGTNSNSIHNIPLYIKNINKGVGRLTDSVQFFIFCTLTFQAAPYQSHTHT